MKIVSPTKACELLEQMIADNKSGELSIAFKPDYRVDNDGLLRLIRLLNLAESIEDMDIGCYIRDVEEKPYITLRLNKVDWDGEIVNYDFPAMGSTILDEDFRSKSTVAYTVNVEEGQTVDLKMFFTAPTLSETVKIAWGDSQEIETTDVVNTISHTYAQAGLYTIFVQGDIIKSSFQNDETKSANSTCLEVIHFIKPLNPQNSYKLFSSFTKLHTIIGTVVYRAFTKPQLNDLFNGSYNLRNIKGLKLDLANNHYSNQYSGQFGRFLGAIARDNANKEWRQNLVRDLRLINFKKENITLIDNFCPICSIDTIPNWLFGKNVTNAYRAFEDCHNIKYLPAGQFDKLVSAYEMFQCRPNVSADGSGSLVGSAMSVSSETKFPNLKNAAGMFSNRLLSFDDIKTIFESLPKNPNKYTGKTGNTRFDNYGNTALDEGSSSAEWCITFSFDKDEPNIKEKLIKYFRLNTNASMQFHQKESEARNNPSMLKNDWDGGWYPIHFTYYGSSWDCNNSKGWFVNFRNPNNYTGYDGPNAEGGIG